MKKHFCFVVIVGKLFGDKTAHGPFPNKEEAEIWGYDNANRQNWEIIQVQQPTKDFE